MTQAIVSDKIKERYLTLNFLGGLIMKEQTFFSEERRITVCALNTVLLKETGIDFISKLRELAKNEKKTEIEAKEFIKKYYPVRTGLTLIDRSNLLLLLDFYIYMVDEHDSFETAATFCHCASKKVPYEDSLNESGLAVFLQNKTPFEKSCAGQFFPAD